MDTQKLKQWVDATNYSRLDKEKIPSMWSYATGALTVTVMNAHIQKPGCWCVTCHEIGMNAAVLKLEITAPLADAQAMALRVVKARLQKYLDSL